jgi:hypothetical protein
VKKIFTYFDTTYLFPEQGELIRLWRDSWKRRGWEPRILNPRTFAHTRRRKHFLEKARQVAPDTLSYYRLVRWLALAEVGGGWFCEYDVINFSFQPQSAGGSRSFSPGNSLVYLKSSEVKRVVRTFLANDFMITDVRLFHYADIHIDYCPAKHVDFGDAGWCNADTVHFGCDAIQSQFGFSVSKYRVVDSCGRTI